MPQKWKRPENVPFPSVWHRFKGKKEVNGVFPKFWVQDIPEELFETAVDMMCDSFIRDEPLCRYSNPKSDKLFEKEMRLLWKECLKNKVGLVCFMENSDPKGKPIIAGLNITGVAEKYEEKVQFKSEKSKKVIGALDHIGKLKDPFETLKVDQYLTALGLSVPPQFRGQSLGLEILKAREPLCRAVGLKATVTTFTSIISQTLAQRCGFKVLAEISYEELEKQDPFLSYPGIQEHTKSIKNMYMVFE